MEHYQQLKTELLEISTVLERFPESLRQSVYELLVSEYLGKKIKMHPTASAQVAEVPSVSNALQGEKKKRAEKPATGTNKRKASGVTPKIDSSLNLRPNGTLSFKDFYLEKSPATVAEFITVALYYLKHNLSITTPTHDQVFTCFKEAGRKVPEAFGQAFTDTKNKQGYINISEDGVPTISLRGENFVDHDLPRAEPKKK